MLFGHFIADRNDGFVSRIAVKVIIKVLKRAVGGLRVAEVDEWDEGNVENSEDCCLSAKVIQCGTVLEDSLM